MSSSTELQRMALVTKNYENLQGLKLVVIGLFLVFGWINGLVVKQGDLSILLPLFVAMMIAFIAVDKYYKTKFGIAKQRKSIVEFMIIVLVLGMIFLADWADTSLQLTISLSGLAIAGLGFLIWLTSDRFRQQYLVMGVLVTAVSLSPLLLGNWINLSLNQGDGFLILGLVYIIGGLIDHLILMQTFHSESEIAE